MLVLVHLSHPALIPPAQRQKIHPIRNSASGGRSQISERVPGSFPRERQVSPPLQESRAGPRRKVTARQSRGQVLFSSRAVEILPVEL